MPMSISGRGGGGYFDFGEMPTVADKSGEGSKIVKICRRLKWMVPYVKKKLKF